MKDNKGAYIIGISIIIASFIISSVLNRSIILASENICEFLGSIVTGISNIR